MPGDIVLLEMGNVIPADGRLLLAGSILCNDAVLGTNGNNQNDLQPVGDPAEGALIMAAARFGLLKNELEQTLPRIGEIPFTSERKLMTTMHRFNAEQLQNDSAARLLPDSFSGSSLPGYLTFSKGAIDHLLQVSSQVWVNGRAEPLTGQWRDKSYFRLGLAWLKRCFRLGQSIRLHFRPLPGASKISQRHPACWTGVGIWTHSAAGRGDEFMSLLGVQIYNFLHSSQ